MVGQLGDLGGQPGKVGHKRIGLRVRGGHLALSIQPQYDYRSGNEPRITGYVVTNTVEAKVRKLDIFSKIVDDAVKAGGTVGEISNVLRGVWGEHQETLVL